MEETNENQMPLFKIGDKLRCKPGYNNNDDSNPLGGGSGYAERKRIIVRSIDTIDQVPSALKYKGAIYWPKDGSNGIYEFALELVPIKLTPEQEKIALEILNKYS